METCQKTFLEPSDKAKAESLCFQAIDNGLKTRGIMRSSWRKFGRWTTYGVTFGFYKGPYDLSYDVLILKSYKAVKLRFSDPHDPARTGGIYPGISTS
ncbi:hypothetical protein Tco_0335056 [Tanacetum coccineum]